MIKLEVSYNDKGQLKCPFISALNNINQDVKKLSDKYIIDVKNRFIFHSVKRKGTMGNHVSYIVSDKDAQILEDTFGDVLIEITSDAFYALLKDYKKNMKVMTLYQQTDKLIVVLDSGDAVCVGRYINDTHIEYESILKDIQLFLEEHIDVIKHRDRFTMLDDDQIERISESIFKCMISDIHIRITKQLVPGISNKFNLGIFLDINSLQIKGNDQICNLYILQERKIVDHFHVYKVLKY